MAHGLLRDLGALLDLGTLRGIRRGFRANDGPGLAAQLAFYLTLALFPLVLVLVSLVGTFSGPQFAAEVLAYFRQILPPPVYGVMELYAADALQGLSPAPGALAAGAAVTLWVAARFFRALISALNRIYGLRETRPAWKVRLFAFLMTLGLSGVVLAGVLLLVAGPSIGVFVAEIFGLGRPFELLWLVARWPTALLFLSVTVALVYYLAPNFGQPFRLIVPGGFVAVLLWALASVAFGFWAGNFGLYDQLYGPIATVILLLIYLYVSCISLLLGAQANAAILEERGRGQPAGETG